MNGFFSDYQEPFSKVDQNNENRTFTASTNSAIGTALHSNKSITWGLHNKTYLSG